MNTLIAKNLNILIDFLAKRDLTALSPDKLQAKYKINQADLLILFGGSIPEGADVFAKAHQQNIAKNYLLVGGAGHTTEALRQKMQSSASDCCWNVGSAHPAFQPQHQPALTAVPSSVSPSSYDRETIVS